MARDVDVEARTTLTVQQIKTIFSSTLQAYSRKVEFGAVQPSDNPFDVPVDFQAYASLKTLTGGWSVQIYIVDKQDSRVVNLLPVGSSALGRAIGGLKNTYSRTAGREKALAVLEQLRTADPALQTA
jgi:cold shock CspA family protein